jgi:hypothetical protein
MSGFFKEMICWLRLLYYEERLIIPSGTFRANPNLLHLFLYPAQQGQGRDTLHPLI